MRYLTESFWDAFMLSVIRECHLDSYGLSGSRGRVKYHASLWRHTMTYSDLDWRLETLWVFVLEKTSSIID